MLAGTTSLASLSCQFNLFLSYLVFCFSPPLEGGRARSLALNSWSIASLRCLARSLLVVQHLDGSHERTHAHLVVLRTANFFGLIVHGVEFADFVTVANGFK